MNVIKGFITIPSLINNLPGQISKLGELSDFSATYAREKADYQLLDVADYRLTTFMAYDTVSKLNIEVEDNQVRQIFEVIAKAITYANANIRPYDSEDFRNSILAQMFGKIRELELGEFIDNGSMALPGWISWFNISTGAFIRVWLSDDAFQDQYDEYEIVVIPPIVPVEDMFDSYGIVSNKISNIKLSDFNLKVENARNGDPESYIRFLSFNFYNVNNKAQFISTPWCILVYGKAGDNIDTIKDNIIAYLLSHSTRSRNDWEIILPEIFKRTEFILIPRWDKMSIPNLTEMSGLYSSIVEPLECIAFAKSVATTYDPSFIENNCYIMPFDYKGLSIVVINGNNNIESKARFNGIFYDYIPVPSTSLDFNRMTQNTRDWILLIEQMLIEAEKAKPYSSYSRNLRKIIRNDVTYVTGVYDNINFLIPAKFNDEFHRV